MYEKNKLLVELTKITRVLAAGDVRTRRVRDTIIIASHRSQYNIMQYRRLPFVA